MLQHTHFVQSLEVLQGGGLGTAAAQLNAAQAKLLHNSVLISTTARDSVKTEETIALRRLGEKPFYAPGLLRIAERQAELGEAVFHEHGFYVYPSFVAGSVARRKNVPLVCHAHGYLEPWNLARSKLKKRLAHELFEDANFKYASLFRALTNVEADQIRGAGIHCQVAVIPNGIELDAFDLVKDVPETDRSIILFLGRLHPKKGLDILVKAWRELPAVLRRQWKVIVAGPDEGGYGSFVKEECRFEIELGEMSFPGVVSGLEKLVLLKSADLFVLPSYSEGLPMAILESLAAKVPVILTQNCNLPEVSQLGGGWECEATKDSFGRALSEGMLAGKDERRQRGALGRALVEEKFQWSQIAQQLEEHCKQLLRRNPIC